MNLLGFDCFSRKGKSRSALALRYGVAMASPQRAAKQRDAAAEAEAVRVHRLREDAQRPMSVNLAEGIALSHKLMRFVGSARTR